MSRSEYISDLSVDAEDLEGRPLDVAASAKSRTVRLIAWSLRQGDEPTAGEIELELDLENARAVAHGVLEACDWVETHG